MQPYAASIKPAQRQLDPSEVPTHLTASATGLIIASTTRKERR